MANQTFPTNFNWNVFRERIKKSILKSFIKVIGYESTSNSIENLHMNCIFYGK